MTFAFSFTRKTLLASSVAVLALAACQPQNTMQATNDTHTQSYIVTDPGPGKLTPERINASPSLAGSTLRRAAISPDGTIVSVLQGRADDANQQDLWAYDLETGEGRLLVSSTDLLAGPEELSEEEKNRRERMREYGSGIVSYSWVNKDLLLFPLGGDLYTYDLSTKQSRQITATKGFETDPKVSTKGGFVAYVRGNELYLTELATGLERQLSDGATDLIRNATASFVVQEELGRRTGYWIDPTATRIAYTQIDESPVAIENRIEFGADGVGNISQRYPFAGTDNATVKLGVVSTKGGATTWVDIGDNPDIYLTRAAWSVDGKTLYAGILSRDNKTHTILKINPVTGASSTLFEETSPTWLNIDSNLMPQKDGSLLWMSEKSDKRQLFRVSKDGDMTALTPEGFLVNGLNCVNQDSQTAYVSGWRDSSLESHLFKVDMGSGDLTQITQGDGMHSARFDRGCTRYIGGFSNPDTPPQTRAFTADGTPLAWLNENALDDNHPYAPYLDAHITPEFGRIPAEDGTMLDYMLYKPLDLQPGEKRPSVTIVYGGPGVQRVNKSWHRRELARMLAHHGFVVFQIDGRGATNRGKAFEDVLYRAMGRAEVVDQRVGADWLKSQDFIDPDKMGVYGWSYGGYMSLHMLGQTDIYKSGVSGAPVTDWALYDTAYTERYLGDPRKDHPNYTGGAYENGSVFPYLDGLTEPVLLIHGMADDNVVFRHSIKLMDEMQKRNAHNMRVMTYPGEKHGFRSEANRVHRDRQILEFFTETLGDD
ncbi:DPP IV N-terminal domain-containing protein [Fretibacter rubidus]|uniref:DPP IV N-terminal domain-containing protein n=1 Tax=Fretibacter rubidus TaxID=570162 RepID=UPI00352BB9EE